MKKILKITVLSLLATPMFAQYLDQDALRLTVPSLNGNARYTSMGGAFGALGGNLSALSTNPASIGIYRRGEFSFTPALTIGQTATKPIEHNSRSRESDLWNFNLGNFGMITTYNIAKSDVQNEWKMVQFGVGLNRLADFWNRSSYTRYADWTYLDVLTDEANKFGLDKFYSGLADKAGLIYMDVGEYWNDLTWYDSTNNLWHRTPGLAQRQHTKTTGAANEWVITFGGNYGDMLYLGATLGLPFVNFRQTKTLVEADEDRVNPIFNSWELRESLDVSGRGVNLKLGAIYRPADFIRLGLAFHTPTRYSLKENFSTKVSGSGQFVSTRTFEETSTYEYYIRTPMRLIGSVGLVIAKQAVIGLEYEHVNYGRMKIDDTDHLFDKDNEFIVDNYGRGGTLKIGGEYRLDPVSLRLGYNYTTSPYMDNLGKERKFSGHSFSAGLGFVAGSTAIDVAYVNTSRTYNMSPYPQMPLNQYNVTGHQIMVTFGWRF
jgi:hypothetical protein